jgi:hypothetical protein
MVQPEEAGSAKFLEYGQIAKQYFGQKYVPWIGWFNNYEEIIQNPKLLNTTIEQLKICKYLQVDEVYIAPSVYFLGECSEDDYSNHTRAVQRLNAINQTLHSKFSSFKVPFTQNRRIYSDFPLWLNKINPHYFTINGNILYDIWCQISFGWLFWIQITQISIITILAHKKSFGNYIASNNGYYKII